MRVQSGRGLFRFYILFWISTVLGWSSAGNTWGAKGHSSGARQPPGAHCQFNLGLLLKVKGETRPAHELFETIQKHRGMFSEAVLTAVSVYETLLKDFPEVREYLPPDRVLPILANEEFDFYSAQMVRLIAKIDESLLQEDLSWRSRIGIALHEILEARLTSAGAQKRVREFLSNPAKYSLGRVLGDLRVNEVLLQLLGDTQGKFTPESAIGYFLAKTGAKFEWRTVGESGAAKKGKNKSKQRLFITISEENFEEFSKLINKMEIFGHFYTPEQETLRVYYGGKTGSYGRLPDDFKFVSGAQLPIILLSSTEAQRLRQVFRLGEVSDSLVRLPWELKGYCERGGIEGCSQWFADLPIGDGLTPAYVFPGRVSELAANALHPSLEIDSLPRVSSLRDYEIPAEYLEGFDPEQANLFVRLVHRVWKSELAPQQLAEALGILKLSLEGHFAKPEGVFRALVEDASFDRVPIVFEFK